MRVLHVYKDYFPHSQGGLEETIRQICRATTAHGVDNRVLTLGPGEAAGTRRRDEATVLCYRRDVELASCGMSLSAFLDFRRRTADVDLVHYHFPWPFADLMHLLRRVRTPAIVTYHSDVVRQRVLMHLYRPLMKRFLERQARIVTTSPNYLASSEALQSFVHKAETIPIGLDEASYPVPDDATLARVQGEVGRGFFLFVGALRYYKGLRILLSAVADTRLPVVIGGCGPEERALKAQADRLRLDNVRFVGHVSDTEKAALYRLSRAVVFPSHLRSEAYGVTLVEGAMFGRPLVSVEIGTGTSYVNSHGETGLVVQPDDPDALREAMRTLAHDDELLAGMGRAARARYERLFTGEEMGRRYVELYERVLGAAGD